MIHKSALYSHGWALCAISTVTLAFAACGGSSSSPQPGNPVGPNLVQVSSDSFTVAPGQHATEVEPHLISNGTTMVAAFQVGRIAPGGATDIGFATSTDAGATWTHGSLPGLTTGEGTGLYDAVSDPAVAYDAKHNVWIIASLPLSGTVSTPAVVVSRSSDGLNWGNPVSVDSTSVSSDKNWIVCDSWQNSPFYGNCYIQWDDPSNQVHPLQILMSTSTDGGLTWGAATPTANFAGGIGGQPLVQPNGNVVVPIEGTINGAMTAFVSTNGGASWSAPVTISSIQFHADAGNIRSGPLPSTAVDGAGTIWTVWQDCRFRANCSTNDLVYSTSTDGVNWSAVTRIPIDDTSSAVDHFIPGIGIDPATSGASAHIALHYYYYSQSNCDASTCQLFVGYISSANGGSTWNTPATLTAAPMMLNWLANSQNGLMVGDYIATAFVNGIPHGVFAAAQATTVSLGSSPSFHEATYTGTGLSVKMSAQQLSSAHDKPLHKLSDKIELEVPEKGIVPPNRRRSMRSAK